MRAQEKTFGVVATGFRAFQRSVERLKSEHGRRNIMAWVHLQANPRPANFNLPELLALVDEMSRTKAGAKPGVDTNASVGPTADNPVGVSAGDDESDNGRGDHDEGGSVDMLVEDEPVADPVIMKAQDLALADMALISTHTDPATWADEISTSVYPSSRPLVVVECPTSRQSTIFSMLDHLKDIPGYFTYGLVLPLGARDDLIGPVRSNLQKRFPGRKVYTVTMSVGKQNGRIRPSYALLLPATLDSQAPTHVDIGGCRARAAEGIRMRCMSIACPLRPAARAEAGGDTMDEIAAEDLDDVDFECCFDAHENADDDDDAICGTASVGMSADGATQNLFPYAAPLAVHERILTDIGKIGNRTHLLVISRTAHPGLVLSGRKAGVKVIALLCGVSPHCSAHGAALLKTLLTASKMSVAREALPASSGVKRRVKASDLQYQVVTAPADQPIRLWDITPEKGTWRIGINNNPTSLDAKAAKQMTMELDDHADKVSLERRDGTEIAIARRPLREGDRVCQVGGLLFETLEKLQAFINNNEFGKDFLGNIVKVDGIMKDTTMDGAVVGVSATSMYFVMTGIGRFFSTTIILAVNRTQHWL